MNIKFYESIINGTNYIYICNEDGSIYIYDTLLKKHIINYKPEKETCISLDISSTYNTIYSSGASNKLYGYKINYNNVYYYLYRKHQNNHIVLIYHILVYHHYQ